MVRHVAVDYGTTKLHGCFRIGAADQAPKDEDIIDLEFDGQAAAVPQKLAFDDEGRFYWGWQVERMLARKELRHDQVIEHLKLLFYPRSLEDSLFARTARDRLDELDPAWLGCSEDATFEVKKVALLALHLRVILERVEAYVVDSIKFKLEVDEESARSMAKKVFISVPGMWLPPGNRSMLKAAEWAGLKSNEVELIFEPQAAAGFWAHSIKLHGRTQYRRGDRMILLDAGGGTSDLVTYELQQNSSTGPELQLKAVGTALGGLCGSEYVNQCFLSWLEDQLQTVHGMSTADAAIALGFSRAQFNATAKQCFEDIKQKASSPSTLWPQEFRVRGPENTIEFLLDETEVAAFSKPVIENNIALVNQLLDDRVRAVVVVGGFAQSEQFMLELKAAFAHKKIDIQRGARTPTGFVHAVARGGLLKYHQSARRSLASDHCFCLSEEQDFAPEKHPDLALVSIERPSRRRAATMIPNKALIGKDPHDPVHYLAKSRVRTILPATDREPVRHYWQQRTVEPHEKTLALQIYWSRDARPEHSPIMVAGTDDTLKDGIEKWGPPLFVELPDLGSLGFIAEPQSHGTSAVYFIAYRVILRWTPERISVRWEMAKPKYTKKALNNAFAYESERLLPGNDLGAEHVIVLLEEDEIAEENFNPTPRE
ncbi:unnamed protein product [Cercospora beticola]|nr:unnamed protein product [Cercospora beticola]